MSMIRFPDTAFSLDRHDKTTRRIEDKAHLIDAERLFLHTWAMDGTVHKKMKAAIASATTALSKAEGRSLSSASGKEGGE